MSAAGQPNGEVTLFYLAFAAEGPTQGTFPPAKGRPPYSKKALEERQTGNREVDHVLRFETAL